MSWKSISLESVSERFISGGTPSTTNKSLWKGDIPWITGADFNEDGVVLGRRFINEEAISNSATNLVPKGSVLLVTRTGVGKVAIAEDDIAISQDITGVIPKTCFDPRFILYAIKHNQYQLMSAQQGATIKGVTRDVVKKLPIPQIALSEQRRIVEILDEADRIRKLRTEADQKAERILPSLFLKMFGDPATNPKGWPVKEFSEVFHDTTSGNEKLQSKQFLASGVLPVIDQGQSRVAGFTDDESLAYRGELPVIVFGDHTRIFKFVDHTFVLGADGVRVLTAKPSVNPLFAYWHCRSLDIPSAGYSRHFKYLKEKIFIAPNRDLQDRFAKVAKAVMAQISVLDETAKKVEKLFTVMLNKAFADHLTAKWREAHMQELLTEMEAQARLLNIE